MDEIIEKLRKGYFLNSREEYKIFLLADFLDHFELILSY